MASKGVARDDNTDDVGTGPDDRVAKLISVQPFDVYVDNKPVVKFGDDIAPHEHTDATMVGCSTTVFVNGKGICRLGDKASCDHEISTCSSTVFADD